MKMMTTDLKNVWSWVWWYLPRIPPLRRLRQGDHKLKASLGYKKTQKHLEFGT
jgi:hypothetical protein